MARLRVLKLIVWLTLRIVSVISLTMARLRVLKLKPFIFIIMKKRHFTHYGPFEGTETRNRIQES